MKRSNCFLPAILTVSISLLANVRGQEMMGGDWHRFSDGQGGGVNARAIAMVGENQILLENSDGEQFETPLEVLTPKDRKWFAEWKAEWDKRAEVGAELNEAIGHDVFRDSWRLWDEDIGDITKRLNWPRESQTPYSSSYRRYTGESYRFLGARPHSVAAYGDDRGLLARLSLVFANKGDSFSAAGMGEDHFEEGENLTTMEKFEKMLATDAQAITKALTGVLGEGERQRYGEGEDRRYVTRWDWNRHSFILSEEEEEYVSLMVVSKDEAENTGRLDRISDQEMGKRLAGNVVREDNGDVRITNIPMVNQGPKGYCVPATFERAMRYQGVPADMYLLAVAGGTAPGGGTNTQRLFNEVESMVRRKGRRPDDVRLDPIRLRTVRRYIDEGVPIMWQMCSLGPYNSVANDRTAKREKVSDWSAYADEIAGEAEENAERWEEEKDNFHVCMIIGYNEKTEELAVSDSWGASYEIRWVHVEEADAVSNGIGFAIRK